MAISITLTSNIVDNTIQQSNLPEVVNLTASAIDSGDPGALFNFSWYLLDIPTGSAAALNLNIGSTVSFTADEWGTYRVFCIAENQDTGNTSNTNPFSAPLNSFIDISVKSTNYELEKPAKSQRNWQDKYWHLVDTVENISANSATFLTGGVSQIASPYNIGVVATKEDSASGDDYMVLSTESFYTSLLPTAGGAFANASQNLMRERLKDVALEQINESSINELSDVVITTPTNGQVLKYNGNNWINGTDEGNIPNATTSIIGVSQIASTTALATIQNPADSVDGEAFLVVATEQLYNTLATNDANGALDPGATNVLRDTVKSVALEQINESSINELSDVNVSSPLSNQFLRYNFGAGQWQNQTVALPSFLDDLTDVSVSSSAANQFLRYNDGTSQWTNQTANLDVLSDVVISAPATRQALKYNGTNWVNGAAVDGLTSNGTNTITTDAGYKIIPAATGQDLGSTTARWDVFAQSGNFSNNLVVSGLVQLESFTYIDDDGTNGGLLLYAGGNAGTGGGETKIKCDSVYLEPTVQNNTADTKLIFENNNAATFTLTQQSKTTADLGFGFPSIVGSAGNYIKIADVAANDIMNLEAAAITTLQSWNAHISRDIGDWPTLTFNGTVADSVITAGLPAFQSPALAAWKNNTGTTITIKKINAFCQSQRATSFTLAAAKVTSDSNLENSTNIRHIGTQLAVTNNNPTDNQLGSGVGSASLSYTLNNGEWLLIVLVANAHVNENLQLQVDYEVVL